MSGSEFQLQKATFVARPLLLGISGPTGSGKTKSALELGAGIVAATGGRMAVIDTESGRSRHYANSYDFDILHLSEPYRPQRYCAAFVHVVSHGASVVIIDSMTHEHAGLGGVLDMHDAEFAALKPTLQAKAPQTAWTKPKTARKRLIDEFLRSRAHVILCFRAKEKFGSAKQDVSMGWDIEGGREYPFQCDAFFRLEPHACGIPVWKPQRNGYLASKRPEYLEHLIPEGGRLDKALGERLAGWATPVRYQTMKPTAQEYARLFGRSALKDVLLAHAKTSKWDELSSASDEVLDAIDEYLTAAILDQQEGKNAEA